MIRLVTNETSPMLTKEQWLERFNLNWQVEKRPLYTLNKAGDNVVALKQKALVRTDSDQCLNVVTDRYTPIQNDKFYDLMGQAESEGLITDLRGGSFGGGKKTWVQAEFNARADVGGNDPIVGKLLMADSNDGSFSFRSTLSPVRIICQNTLSTAISDGPRIAIRHTATSGERLDQLKVALDKMKFDFSKVAALYNEFSGRQITSEELNAYFKTVLGIKGDPTDSEELRIHKLINLFENGRGQTLNRTSVWSAYNAVTEYTTHSIVKDSTKRKESLMFGRGNELNNKAFIEATRLLRA